MKIEKKRKKEKKATRRLVTASIIQGGIRVEESTVSNLRSSIASRSMQKKEKLE